MKSLSIPFFVCFLSISSASFGQTGKISGIISEGSSNQTVSGAKIEVKSKSSGNVIKRLLSESNGSYLVSDLAYGIIVLLLL